MLTSRQCATLNFISYYSRGRTAELQLEKTPFDANFIQQLKQGRFTLDDALSFVADKQLLSVTGRVANKAAVVSIWLQMLFVRNGRKPKTKGLMTYPVVLFAAETAMSVVALDRQLALNNFDKMLQWTKQRPIMGNCWCRCCVMTKFLQVPLSVEQLIGDNSTLLLESAYAHVRSNPHQCYSLKSCVRKGASIIKREAQKYVPKNKIELPIQEQHTVFTTAIALPTSSIETNVQHGFSYAKKKSAFTSVVTDANSMHFQPSGFQAIGVHWGLKC